MNPLFSIITITFNAQKQLPSTLESVKAQSCTDFEHIIIDGGSRDNTVAIAKEHGIDGIIIVSEPDNGLYDAMNKGIIKASGKYLIFLNAGDAFAEKKTLQDIANTAKSTNANIIYGQTRLVNDLRKPVGMRHLTAPDNLTVSSFKNGMLVCHQAFVVSKSIAPFYNLKYRFSADYDWCIRCLKLSNNNAYTGTIIIDYLTDGMTDKNRKASLIERFHIMCHHFGTLPTIARHISFIPRFIKTHYNHK
ncbi:MAG: glycosyltransferase family 2 protein [Muribaculaceae bacterium]